MFQVFVILFRERVHPVLVLLGEGMSCPDPVQGSSICPVLSCPPVRRGGTLLT